MRDPSGTRGLAPLLALVLGLSACQAGGTGPAADPPVETVRAVEEVGLVGPTKAPSPGYVPLTDERVQAGSRLVGEPEWTVYQHGAGIGQALESELGPLSEAYMREHGVRPDRWTGTLLVKPGEMDAYADKVTPALADEVHSAVADLHVLVDEHGGDSSAWPRKERSRAGALGDSLSKLMLNFADPTEGGRGDFVHRVKSRHLFRGRAQDGWKGAAVGKPVTFYYVEVRRRNGTGTPRTLGVWQVWTQVRGSWRVLTAGWEPPAAS
jgi:hypothetical protein